MQGESFVNVVAFKKAGCGVADEWNSHFLLFGAGPLCGDVGGAGGL